MEANGIHSCGCAVCCGKDAEHPDRKLHRQLNLVLSRLNEQQRRWVVALEVEQLGHGGATLMSLVTGMHVETIRRGREEVAAGLEDRPVDRVRLPGAGRPRVEKKIRESLIV